MKAPRKPQTHRLQQSTKLKQLVRQVNGEAPPPRRKLAVVYSEVDINGARKVLENLQRKLTAPPTTVSRVRLVTQEVYLDG